MRFLYTFLFYLLLPFIVLRLLWKSRRLPAYRARILERFGDVPFELKESIWIHAVSMGETIAAIPMIKAIQKVYPAIPLIVTNMTPTGAARVKAAFGQSVWQAYIPYDTPAFLTRFMKKINPRLLVIMETELWPNLFSVCQKHSIPIIIANARLSAKSARGYSHIPWLNKPMFDAIHYLAAQSSADLNRFFELGLPKEKGVVTGNLKFDIEIAEDLSAKSSALRKSLGEKRPLWIAASTHPTEEEILLKAHQLILQKNSEALLLLVPRHPDRFKEVASLVQTQGLQLQCRSETSTVDAKTEVYLGDTMGELMLLYAVSDVALVAGSLITTLGGHNMLEPAVLQTPILSGPSMYNFSEVSRLLLESEGLKIVYQPDDIAEAVLQLFADEKQRIQMGENAYKVVAANRGALGRHVELIKKVLR